MLRAAVLPTVVAALSGAVAVLSLVRFTGIRPSTPLWIALGGAAALALFAVLAAWLAAGRVATTVFGRCLALRRESAQGQDELRRVLEHLRNGRPVPAPRSAQPAVPGSDAFELLAQELGRHQEFAVTAVVEASRLADRTGDEQRVEVFVNLARRLQSLVHREIQLLDELEHEVEDPDLLKGLFHVDHLATRIRRHAENLAVLGGAVSRRQWSSPVTMTEVLRSAIAEVEQYPRVKLIPPIDGTLRGHAVADVIHLLAELVENATVFSAPHTQVLLRAQQVTAGLALEVEDRGLGMPGEEQKRMNALLADPDRVNVAHLLQDGRIGLFVVASLARRHGVAVRLQSNIYGGTQAVLVLPRTLLGAGEDKPDEEDTVPPPNPGAAHHPPAEAHHRPDPDTARALNGRQDQHGGRHQVQSRNPNPAPGPGAGALPNRNALDGSAPHDGPLPSRGPAPGTGPVGARAGAKRQPYVPSQPLRLPARTERPAPPAAAESRPGARHTDGEPPVLERGSEAARGAVDRPRLPRRVHQEHLVPELRQPPAPRVEDEQALHDPGLMAAFRRGIDLAEARSESEANTGPEPANGPGTEPGPDPAATSDRQPPASPEPLPVRMRTAPFTPHRPAAGQDADASPAGDPHEANIPKE